ncbi:hypothetical protein GCG54_00006357 [Colletotrichum gloeosporioides]|uniref:Uncharacterized protein n=1 Tax=Colletotrichum gloeosporioides TaxID=474922 RepID=A0A8H4CR12_COLGL|nr:uncharacterized protein GCG54_00006357 [Colletotrichum gloeosporioides]KAF3808494.1 hypothetical protein GCG54_00006357 [Colletotrichum gloeosporioides]
MRFKIASDDTLDLRDGILTDLRGAREEAYRAELETEAARKVLELAQYRQERAQKKVKQLKARYDIAERMVWPANDEYWGAAEVMHDAKQNAGMLEKGPRPVIDWEKESISEFGDRARNVSADVGERALPSLIAAGPNRSQKRVKRHHPYPTKKDLPPRLGPLVELSVESQSQDPVEVKVSKLNEDTVIDVGHKSYLVRQDPEEIWSRFMATSNRDDRRAFNEAHKNDLLNMFGYGPRQAVKPSELIDTKWGIMQVMSREEAERNGWLPAEGSA